MNGDIQQLLNHPVNFLGTQDLDGDIAISSRIRLARNLSNRPFPIAASGDECEEVNQLVEHAAKHTAMLGGESVRVFDPGMLNEVDREILLERHLASREFIVRPEHSRLLVSPDERYSIMVNEEDQLRIQTVAPGAKLFEVWKQAADLDDQLGANLNYAFDSKLGFLTSCPTNVGTGMRASVMLHLPGLTLTGQINATIQGINKLHLAVRGIFGEGTKNLGALYQISNQSTLGESETAIIEHLNNVITQLINYEKNARNNLLENNKYNLLDHVGRAYGALRHSYCLSFEEGINCLSGVRLGVDMGMFPVFNIKKINDVFIGIGPAHLQKFTKKILSASERDVCRAEYCRNNFKN